nr:hypothetical protein [Tanacetum cinerariifolium]
MVLAYMLITDELPFKFVEGKGFKHFLNATQPLFHTPTKITKARDCMKLFLEEKKKVGVQLSGNDVDNASANDVVVAYLKSKFANWEKFVLEDKWLHVRCTDHVINLIVQDSLGHIRKSVDCVRASVKYIRQSPQSYERAFSRYDSEDRHYRDDLEKIDVSGILYVTSNTFLDDITSIDAALNNCINEVPDKNLAAMAKMMKCKFHKYYGSLEKCNMATIVASMLDLRNKFEDVLEIPISTVASESVFSTGGRVKTFGIRVTKTSLKFFDFNTSSLQERRTGFAAVLAVLITRASQRKQHGKSEPVLHLDILCDVIKRSLKPC